MDERRAREVTLLEAFETAQPPSPSWSDDDRRWADRVAVEAARPGSAPDAFIRCSSAAVIWRMRLPASFTSRRRPSMSVRYTSFSAPSASATTPATVSALML